MEPDGRFAPAYDENTRVPAIVKRRDFIKSSVALTALGASIPSLLVGSKNRFSFRNSAIDSDRIVLRQIDITFMDAKTGGAKPEPNQKQIRDVVANGKVRSELL